MTGFCSTMCGKRRWRKPAFKTRERRCSSCASGTPMSLTLTLGIRCPLFTALWLLWLFLILNKIWVFLTQKSVPVQLKSEGLRESEVLLFQGHELLDQHLTFPVLKHLLRSAFKFGFQFFVPSYNWGLLMLKLKILLLCNPQLQFSNQRIESL